MQFYSRTSQRPAANGTYPGPSFTPDGGMRLAVPLSPAPEAASVGSAAGTGGITRVGGGDSIVLMHPSSADLEESAPRSWLLMVILCDFATLVACLCELSWRTVYVSSIVSNALGGMAVLTLGAVSCYWRMPLLLGAFATASTLSFLTNALQLQSFWQLCHVALQPLLVRFALMLRRALVPQWFAHGRSVES